MHENILVSSVFFPSLQQMDCANVNEENSPQKKKKKAPSLESANPFETIAAGMPVMQKCERCSVVYGNFLVTLVETKANTLHRKLE